MIMKTIVKLKQNSDYAGDAKKGDYGYIETVLPSNAPMSPNVAVVVMQKGQIIQVPVSRLHAVSGFNTLDEYRTIMVNLLKDEQL